MKGACILAACALAHTECHAQDNGTLDPNFNTTGYNINDISGNATSDRAVGLALMSNGRYFVAGTVASESLGLARFASDGGLQVSALRLATAAPGSINARACVKNPQNTFYVAASQSTTGTNKQWVIARFNEDLSFDTYGQSFPPGHTKLNWGDPDTEVGGLAVQTGGKAVLAGYVGGNIAVAQFTSAGILDNTFSSDGMVITDVPGGTDEKVHAVAIAPDGGIIVAGEMTTTPSGARGLVGRYNANGDIDFSFGTNGFTSINYTGSVGPGGWGIGGQTRFHGMTIQPDGKIVLVGRCTNTAGDETDFLAARLNADGSLDGSFGPNGLVKVGFDPDPPFNTDVAYSVALDASDALIIAGTVSTSGGSIGLVRVLNDGTVDENFGTNGTVTTDLGNQHTVGAVVVDGQRIVVAGGVRTGLQSSTNDSFIARYFNNTVGVLEFSMAEHAINVYPNPIAEAVTFQYTLLESERLTIALHDLQGRVITTFLEGQMMPAGDHRQVVSMPADLASGNYLLVFSSPKGRMSVQVSK